MWSVYTNNNMRYRRRFISVHDAAAAAAPPHRRYAIRERRRSVGEDVRRRVCSKHLLFFTVF